MKLISTTFLFMLVLGVFYSSITTAKSRGKPVPLSYFCVNITYRDGHNNEYTNEEKSPILLIHGLQSYKEEWMSFTNLFAIKTGRLLCAADLRNHGASPWSDEYDIATMAEDVNFLLETLHFEKVVLLGHSLGGKVSVEFALNYPEKIEKLIIEDMRPNGITDEVNEYLKNADALEKFDEIIPKGSTEMEAKKAVYEYLRVRDEWAYENIKFYYPIICSDGHCRFQANMNVLENIRKGVSIDLEGSEGICEKPALFIYGGKSPFKVRDVEEEIMKLFPKAKLVEVEEAGHVLQPHQEFTEEVINFINEKNC